MNVKQYMAETSLIGCIICGMPAELHHPRFTMGMGQRNSDWLVIPLCASHHRTGPFGQCIHNGQHTFEANYGTEAELLALTIQTIMRGAS